MAQWTSKTNSQGWAMSRDLHGECVGHEGKGNTRGYKGVKGIQANEEVQDYTQQSLKSANPGGRWGGQVSQKTFFLYAVHFRVVQISYKCMLSHDNKTQTMLMLIE